MPRPGLASPERARWIRCVALTGVLVGAADYAIGLGIFVAALGRPALGVLQAPAAGVLGVAAFRGGLPTAALGTALHFAIAAAWAAAFAAAYASSRGLRRASAGAAGLALVGAAAGALVWVVMNNVVAPLGRGRPEPFGTGVFWAVLVGHVFFVGIPLVWGTRRLAPTGGARRGDGPHEGIALSAMAPPPPNAAPHLERTAAAAPPDSRR